MFMRIHVHIHVRAFTNLEEVGDRHGAVREPVDKHCLVQSLSVMQRPARHGDTMATVGGERRHDN